MTKKLSITIFIFLISLCVYSNKLVSGTVVDCKTNLPIPGAEIIINNQEPKFTNFDGYFEIEVSTDLKEIFIKYPKLLELYNHFFNDNPNNLHNAMADVVITLICYYKMEYNENIVEISSDIKYLKKCYL